MRCDLEASGLQIGAFGSFEQREEQVVARIDDTSVRQAIIEVGGAVDCDAVFVSCTNLRTLETIAEVEAALDKPVMASNLALAWHMLRLAGLEPAPDRRERLFRATR